MPRKSEIYIPFPRELYDDIIRFSDGRIDPATVAENTVRGWIESSLELGDDDWAEDRRMELAEAYAPHIAERWQKADADWTEDFATQSKPLVWKEVSIRARSDVRMSYGGQHHYAIVKAGRIVDDGKEFSPSEWASKIAGGTSRNAWRDLWFKEPMSTTWVPAHLLRDQALEALRERSGHSAQVGGERDED